MNTIGIRKEDKGNEEFRAPLAPEHIHTLLHTLNISTIVEPAENRAFSASQYLDAGAQVSLSLQNCPIILGIKEILPQAILPNKIYMFFSHSAKGQPENMPMLKQLLVQKCTLIDYEKMTNAHGKRILYFGTFAGYAGMIDTLAIYGRRLALQNISHPFTAIKQAFQYNSFADACAHLQQISVQLNSLQAANLPPLVCGFAGYGNVSQGAQYIYDLLNPQLLSPQELLQHEKNMHGLYKVVFHEKDMFAPNCPTAEFHRSQYFTYPDRFHSVFKQYLPFLTLLVNGIYWEKRYPRLVTKKWLQEMQPQHLQVIGDISCDVDGAIEITTHTTNFSQPAYVYNYEQDEYFTDLAAPGIAVLAVDHLPSEFPRESSIAFGNELMKYLPALCQADFSNTFAALHLMDELKNAIIVYKGELTPNYKYLEQFLRGV